MFCITISLKTSASQQGDFSENAVCCGTSLGSQLLADVSTTCRARELGLPGFPSYIFFAGNDPL